MIAAARRHCEELTRTRAANFYYGIRLLPDAKRSAMCAVYAFARRVDDIGDGDLPPERKLAELERARADVNTMSTASEDPVICALADACARFGVPRDALTDLIEGVAMDVRGASYESFDELVGYCRHVAGTIGRCCVALFGSDDARAGQLADDLGVAMQLTNILRDVREDAANGRVYLPAEDLRHHGWIVAGADPHAAVSALVATTNGAVRPQVAQLMRFEARRAGDWFERGLELVPLLDRRSAACVLAMTGIYRRLLERIERDPEEVLRRRMSVPIWEKAWVATRSMVGAGA